MKPYFDAIVIVPLEEEFEVILSHFEFDADLSDDKQIMFSAWAAQRKLNILLAKQIRMGKTATQESILHCLDICEAGLLICIGIAGGLSSDVAIGDVCYSSAIIDVLDNSKTSDTQESTQDLALSPTFYPSPQELMIAISLDRISPVTKGDHEAWAVEHEKLARALIPGEFSGKDGKKEVIKKPIIREGVIVCGLVSGSPAYNKKLKGIDRKVLAIETESGGLFSIAQLRNLPALTVRGICDYAGIDKNKFEEETANNARKIATENAGSFLARLLGTSRLLTFFHKIQVERTNRNSQLSSPLPHPKDSLLNLLMEQTAAINNRLCDLAPGYALQSKGYHLPVPRIRTIETRSAVPSEKKREPVEVREALRDARLITLQLPKEYPDLSLSWIIANDLLSADLEQKKVIPWVIEARVLQKPRVGIKQLIAWEVISSLTDEQVKHVFIIDDFSFESKTRVDFLKEQIDAWPEAKFIVMTRSRENLVLESEFTKNIASATARVCDVSFMEISHFIQKNFEMSASASEVVAVRLRETFRKYALSAHPSYFAGIPRATLNALLQVNRRAELIDLAVAGYLSFVVAEDKEPIPLSRTTREKFLAEVAFLIRAEGRSFTELQLTTHTEEFAKTYDFCISPARFVALFIEKRILHVEDGLIRFTLPFVESYLLAKLLTEDREKAKQYFSIVSSDFDHRTFALYAEMGAIDDIITEILKNLDKSIEHLINLGERKSPFIDSTDIPNILKQPDRLQIIQKRLEKAENDVRNDRDQTQEKQRLLDASDKIRENASARFAEAQSAFLQGGVDDEAVKVWSIAVSLLGSGAERLIGKTKRSLVSKIIELSGLIVDNWTRAHKLVNFAEIKKDAIESDLIIKVAKSNSEDDRKEAKKTIGYIVDFIEYFFLLHPFLSVISYLCEEARDDVLAQSIVNTSTNSNIEELLRTLWLTDINVPIGNKKFLHLLSALPNTIFLRTAIATHIMTRVYWGHWDKEHRLLLLDAASESLKGAGINYDKSRIKRIIKKLPDPDDTEF